MADRVYLRHSTDTQTDARQRHALAALLAAGAPVYEDPATSSRQLSLDRAGFTELLHEAAVGDTIRVADAARLFRSVADIIALRPVLIRRSLHLRVESGLLSGIDLASDDPGTKMMVSVLAAVLEFQRDMISENTREGVAAAEASGKTLGRPAVLGQDQATTVVEAYRKGAAVKALARRHQVDPRTIRRVLDAAGARDLPDQLDRPPAETGEQHPVPTRDPEVVLDLPGLLADHLRTADDGTVRQAVGAGRTIRRGRGHSLRITAPLEVHRAALQQSAALAADTAGPAERKAYRVYATRITTAEPAERAATAAEEHACRDDSLPVLSSRYADLVAEVTAAMPPAVPETPRDNPIPAGPPLRKSTEQIGADLLARVRGGRRRLTQRGARALVDAARAVKDSEHRDNHVWHLVAADGTEIAHARPSYGGSSSSGRNGWIGWPHGMAPSADRPHPTKDAALSSAAYVWIRLATQKTTR